nr:GNAT family N-acetyltransferase [Marinicella sp. W31]MDC2877898.1 GNAT family N-acetyltransferase [Marinicella sp. W31]
MEDRLTFRQDYFSDLTAFEALAALLQEMFGIDIRSALGLAGLDKTTMPFGYFDTDGRCVANFSVFSVPLMVEGRRVIAAAYQSGAVRPEYRGQGLYRDLMRRAFTHARTTGHEADILMTHKPGLYEPYGLRQVRLFGFRGPAPASHPQTASGRKISIDNEGDVALIAGMLDRREPVSRRFAVRGMKEFFLLNALWQKDETTLTHLPGLDAVIAWKAAEGRLVICDIVAPAMPALSEICAGLGGGFSEVETRFSPDLLQWLQAHPVADPHIYLMVSAALTKQLSMAPVGFTPLAEF